MVLFCHPILICHIFISRLYIPQYFLREISLIVIKYDNCIHIYIFIIFKSFGPFTSGGLYPAVCTNQLLMTLILYHNIKWPHHKFLK